MARFLIGDEVEEIFVSAGVMVDPAIGQAGDVDTALIVLRFRNGVIGTIDNCRQAAYGYDQRAEVFGSLGKIGTENRYANQAVVSTGQNVRSDLPMNFFMDRYKESFAEELRQFAEAVIHDKPTPVTGQDGRIPVQLGLAAMKSYKEHRPVRVAEIGQTVSAG
jgi:myo-inositol 2-dehydrogenase/D-chiro-inositol 1-dehydrogenase